MNNLTGKRIEKNRKKKTSHLVSQFILCRMPGGKLYENLARDIRIKDYRVRLAIDSQGSDLCFFQKGFAPADPVLRG